MLLQTAENLVKNGKNPAKKSHPIFWQTIQILKIVLAQQQHKMYNCNTLIINTSSFLEQKIEGL